MAESELLTLKDGRSLEYRVSGPEDGTPLFFHHGTPGAAVPFRALERAAHARGLRLVTTSRPGYGASSRLAGRRIVDVATDAAAVLEAIGAPRCLIVGWSGGGPHALACAARLPAAKAALVIAGVAPYGAAGLDWMAGMGEENVLEFGAAVQGETALAAFLEELREQRRDLTVDNIIAALSSLLPPVDRAVLTDEFGEDLVASYHAAMRPGIEGWLDDDLSFLAPWGFELAEIAIPTAIWQGDADLMVPFAHGQWLASNVPGPMVHLQEGEGHLSVGIGAIDAMLDELVTAAAGR